MYILLGVCAFPDVGVCRFMYGFVWICMHVPILP